jgi:hypothetical protein
MFGKNIISYTCHMRKERAGGLCSVKVVQYGQFMSNQRGLRVTAGALSGPPFSIPDLATPNVAQASQHQND